ncbi:nucleotidyltransferase family protein [Mucilaginibacter sp. SP1R1]|uniref:nucleotidyltransferase family protein n=1 Tax=Mucilaginibacter sp. SP1R1 TaxID=2723091 RepID=UPI0016094F07|nr:nucleotidyltransferase family protein [Mucilaginibacter sp. SP1R1]MBB6150510.1 molybdenum cofactor cytidylyltransferase [Mucilaginibacter sp. SP1R1]
MTGLIILAAGSSSRLGTPKQNLVYQGQTLLQRAIQTALTSVCSENVVVVLGANENVIRPGISDQLIHIAYNSEWQEGLSSSIRLGIQELLKIEPNISSAILMLCDQPFVDPLLIYQLIEKKAESDHGIIACAYRNTLGVPVLFDASYFPQLLMLQGKEGAKKLIKTFPNDVLSVGFPMGAIDIDTMEDYEQLGGR